jgi:hypothetical protein
MIKSRISNLLLFLGLLFLVWAYMYYLLITSDIPVEYSIAESLYLHVVIFISTFLFICGSITISQKRIFYISITTLTIFFIVNLLLFNLNRNAEYFTSSYAQLSIAFLLHPILIILVNIFLLTKE